MFEMPKLTVLPIEKIAVRGGSDAYTGGPIETPDEEW